MKPNIEQLKEIEGIIKEQEKEKKNRSEKRVLSESVLEYAKNALSRVQEKLRNNQHLYESDFEFVDQIYRWMKMSEKLRAVYSSIEAMSACEKESRNRAKELATIISGGEYTDELFEDTFFFDGATTVIDEALELFESNEFLRFPEVMVLESRIDIECEGIVLPRFLHIKKGGDFGLQVQNLHGRIIDLRVDGDAKFALAGGKLHDIDYEKGDQLIPEDAEIDGKITLVEIDVKNLPERLMIGQSIEFNHVKDLSLPKELIVEENLFISESAITGWPDLLVVSGDVYCTKEQRTKINELMRDGKATIHGQCISDRPGMLW
jgi:hypothetical protein